MLLTVITFYHTCKTISKKKVKKRNDTTQHISEVMKRRRRKKTIKFNEILLL